MRNVLVEFGQRARVLPWKEARRLCRDEDFTVDDSWKEKAAYEIALHLAKGPKYITDPELLALGLEKAKADLPAFLVAQRPRAMREVLRETVEAANRPELGEDVEKLFSALYRFSDPEEGSGAPLEL
jgi:hypothetical protein